MPAASYVGKAGDFAVMSEFLLRGYNVAIPEVDVGDDVLVIHDRKGELYRIQVKTATGIARKDGYSGAFSVPLRQLTRVREAALDFVFALRKSVGAWDYLIVSRKELHKEHKVHRVGHIVGDDLKLYIAFRDNDVICSGRSFQRYRNNWDRWPIIG